MHNTSDGPASCHLAVILPMSVKYLLLLTNAPPRLLQVSRKQGAGGAFALEEEVDKDLPFARTCTHTVRGGRG